MVGALDIELKPGDGTIVVAMSGGVDSSCVAALLHEAGHNVIGITMKLYDHSAVGETLTPGFTVADLKKSKTCCAGQDIYDAKRVADHMGFPHYVFDYENRFKTAVIDDFVDSYLRGETPLPCVRCNQSLKFEDLAHAAHKLGGSCLVTGHYVRHALTPHGMEMHKGNDLFKDQSYFLFATTKKQLSFLRFPLGGVSKDWTRAEAFRLGIEVANKPDSQDICFVPNGSYKDVIKHIKPDSIYPGAIMHIDGYRVGEHDGIVGYTIGQRRGLGIAHSEPLYVVRIDASTNTVFVAEEKHLYCSEFYIKECNWIGDNDGPENGMLVDVKVRARHSGTSARVYLTDKDGIWKIVMLAPDKAITPGQACVIYDGSRVLGGGWIIGV